MTNHSIAIACWSCALAVVIASPLDRLGADEVTTRRDSTSVLQRLPISFRMVDRGTSDGSRPTTSRSAEVLPLAPRGGSSDHAANRSPPSAGRAIATVASSLAVVVGLLVAITWFARRYHPAVKSLPRELFLHLGTTNIAGRQAIHVMRFGDKLLLVAAGPAGLQPLGELTNADDVQRLTTLCRPTSSNPISSTFQRVVADWSRESSQSRNNLRAPRSTGNGGMESTRMGETSHA